MTATPSPNLRPVIPTFEQELCELVFDTAPRLFAVVQVWGDGRADADGWVVAWGLAEDGGSAYVIGIDGRTQMTLASPDRAVHHFGRQPGITARLVWLGRPDRAEAA